MAWLVSFGSVSVTDAPALDWSRFLLIRSHVACVSNRKKQKNSGMERVVGAVKNIAFLDSMEQMLRDVGFCMQMSLASFEENAASPGRDRNPGHHQVFNAMKGFQLVASTTNIDCPFQRANRWVPHETCRAKHCQDCLSSTV